MVPMFTAALLTKSNTWKQPTSMNEGMDKNMWHFTHTHIHAQWNIVNKPGMLWFRGSQRVGHDWVTELNWTEHVDHKLPKNLLMQIWILIAFPLINNCVTVSKLHNLLSPFPAGWVKWSGISWNLQSIQRERHIIIVREGKSIIHMCQVF